MSVNSVNQGQLPGKFHVSPYLDYATQEKYRNVLHGLGYTESPGNVACKDSQVTIKGKPTKKEVVGVLHSLQKNSTDPPVTVYRDVIQDGDEYIRVYKDNLDFETSPRGKSEVGEFVKRALTPTPKFDPKAQQPDQQQHEKPPEGKVYKGIFISARSYFEKYLANKQASKK